MKILSIDTSTMVSGCSVMEDGIIIGDYNINQEKTHSETLVPMTKQLLDGLGLRLEDIDLFAVGIGPGSFTGLRIGITTVKTFAQVLEKEVIPVSTLEAIAYNISSDSIIIPLLDARGGRTYYAVFKQVGGEIERIEKDELIYIEDLVEQIKGKYEDPIFIGEYSSQSKAILESIPSRFARDSMTNIISRNICEIAYNKYKLGMHTSLDDVLPNYVRKSQAQRDLERG